jgi:hypothetical protein
MLFRIGATEIGWASVFIYLPFLTLAIHIVTRSESYGGAEAIENHLRDFPYDGGSFGANREQQTPPVSRRDIA